MLSLYHAYQAYERRAIRGELDAEPAAPKKANRFSRPPFTFRLGDLLIRTGLRLKHQTQAGHALASTTMAEK
jgi:hypothetical protein